MIRWWCLLCNVAILMVVAFLCTPAWTVAFTIERRSRVASFNSVTKRTKYNHLLTPGNRRRICIETALANLDSGETASDNTGNIKNDKTDAPTATPSQKPQNGEDRPLDAVGDKTLRVVQYLARVVGSAAEVDTPETDDVLFDEEATGNGIANVFSGRRPASGRERLIKWQRWNLRGVREDTMRTAASLDGDPAAVRGGSEDGRTAQLDAALRAKRRAERNEGGNGEGNGRPKNGNAASKDPTLIATALQTLEKDMALLDNLTSLQPQLSGTEVGLLIGAVLASGIGPIAFPGTSVTEVLAPAAAAFSASITIGSEYIGRVAVADGKEIAANSIQCAAEAEALLANAERVKAITPLCVGVGATCASFALLTPTFVEALNIRSSVIMMTELYLLCPLVSVLSAAVANLALEETRGFASRAVNVGVRRFSKSGNVGRTWLSSSEQVQRNSRAKTERWMSFAGSVLPAPIVGSILGGPKFSTKCIVVAALAAAQSAYFLAQAESVVARATDAVALKARSAAVSDTYANQGARNSAILPFTSALSAFCAAATAATVELPFIESISNVYGTFGEVALVSAFPILSSGFAAAAAVSKARCEVDAEAAAAAASTLALEYEGSDESGDDPVLQPFQAVKELVRLAVSSGLRSIKKGVLNPLGSIWSAIWGFARRNGSNSGGEGLAWT